MEHFIQTYILPIFPNPVYNIGFCYIGIGSTGSNQHHLYHKVGHYPEYCCPDIGRVVGPMIELLLPGYPCGFLI